MGSTLHSPFYNSTQIILKVDNGALTPISCIGQIKEPPFLEALLSLACRNILHFLFPSHECNTGKASTEEDEG